MSRQPQPSERSRCSRSSNLPRKSPGEGGSGIGEQSCDKPRATDDAQIRSRLSCNHHIGQRACVTARRSGLILKFQRNLIADDGIGSIAEDDGKGYRSMSVDEEKIDDAVLALLQLTLHNDRMAWKGFDWAVTDRLHRKGFIQSPAGMKKSLALTDEGLERSKLLFETLFCSSDAGER